METRPNCPECGKPVPPGVLLGLCPECLVKSGFETGTAPCARRESFVPPPLSEIAKAFPQFEIISLIGQGGMGAVYKVRQPKLDRFVALKILSPRSADNPGFAERFNREARALARLNHPNIVTVHDFGSAEMQPSASAPAATLHYLLMEFVDGMNLRELERAKRLIPEQALQIIPQICDALQFAHTEGVIHRDIKPENMLIDQKGRVKITDFGIAKIIGATAENLGLTGARDIIGTPHYMAPEQVERPNAVDHRADIYSLGVVFYELLTGELPLGKFAPPSSKVLVDVRLDTVVLRTLEKEPARRYQQAGDVKTAMQTIATTPPGAPPKRPSMPAPVPPTPPRHRTGLWIVTGVATAIVLAGIAVVVVLLLFWRSSRAIQPIEAHNPPTNSPPTVTARAADIAEHLGGKELTETELRDALIDLKSSSPALRQIAAHKLALAKPGVGRAEVETELLAMIESADWSARQSAARALGIWGTTNSVQPLIRMLDDPTFSVRWAAIEALGNIKDGRAIDPLAKHLDDGQDVFQTANALKSFGAAAEAPAIVLLQNGNSESRRAACGILREVGSRKCVPALTAAASDSDGIVAMLAKDALKAVDAR